MNTKRLLFLDTESVGLMGYTRLVQYAIDDGPVQFIILKTGWESDGAVREQLRGLFSLLDSPDTLFIGYQIVHDQFHLLRLRHRFEGYEYDSQERPIQPFRCASLDLATWAVRCSPLAPFAYSKGSSKSVAAVRRIPRVAKDIVGARVEESLRTLLPSVCELKRSEHDIPGKKNLVTLSWTVEGRVSLKNLMKVYGLKTIALAECWPLPEKGEESLHLPYPTEVHERLVPQCDSILSDPTLPFFTYAELDIWFTKVLYEKLGKPEPDHHDECCSSMAYVRYHGYVVDRETLLRTKEAYEKKVKAAEEALVGTNLKSSKQRLALLRQYDPLIASSAKKVIKAVAESDRPCAPIAKAMMDFNTYKQRLDQVNKVLESRTGRCHPTLRIMGTRTGRMAGEAGLNWQGIPKVKKESKIGIRAAMEVAAVGDWKALEVILGANVYKDEAMFYDIENDIDPHASTAALLPDAVSRKLTYQQIIDGYNAGDAEMTAIRSKAKPCNFLLQYFGAAPKLADSTGMTLEEAEKFVLRFHEKYKGFAAYKARMQKECVTADTERWSKDSVSRMKDSITDLTGYTTSWTFEKMCSEALWKLGGQGIHTGMEGSLIRTPEKGSQTVDGAIKSALLGGAIAIQNAVMRQRGNAAVQSLGANLTKMLQARLWVKYRMPSTNCHDELFFCRHPNFDYSVLQREVNEFTAEWLQQLKFIHFDLKEARTWSEK